MTEAHPFAVKKTELIWEGKYDGNGKRVAPLRVALPFQTVETVEYTAAAGNLRYYEPDFVAVLGDGKRYIVETKGQEDVNVANKDRAAAICCENATILTGETWKYLKVQHKEYAKLQADTFADLAVLGQGVLV
jgi:hypothetical protein